MYFMLKNVQSKGTNETNQGTDHCSCAVYVCVTSARSSEVTGGHTLLTPTGGRQGRTALRFSCSLLANMPLNPTKPNNRLNQTFNVSMQIILTFNNSWHIVALVSYALVTGLCWQLASSGGGGGVAWLVFALSGVG